MADILFKGTKVKALFFILLILIPLAGVRANNLSFLNDINIRNSGASGSLAPFSSDASCAFVNPACLAFTQEQEIRLLYYNLFAGSSISSVSYAYPLLNAGSVSISGVFQNTPSIEERNAFNEITGSFSDSYKAVYLSYGISLNSFLSAGANIKYINHDFYNSGYSAGGVDAGLVLSLPYNLMLSALSENIVKPEFQYSSTSGDSLPLYFDFTLGDSFSFFSSLNDSLKVGIGVVKEEWQDIYFHYGAEYSIYNIFFLRAGISLNSFSFGACLNLNGAGIDYAYVSTALDFVHRFSISYSFGENIRAMEAGLRTKEEKLKYEMIQEIKQKNIDDFMKQADDSIKTGDFDSAKATVEKALVWDPNNSWFKDKLNEINNLDKERDIKSLSDEADALMNDKLYIDAMVKLKSLFDLDPNNTSAKEKYDYAETVVTKLGEENLTVEEKNKQEIKTHFDSGISYYASGSYEKAVEEWDKVIDASPMQRQVYNFIKTAEEKVRKKEEVKQTAEQEKAQKINMLYNKAVLLYTQGNFEESINTWKELLTLDPENKEAKEYLEKIKEEYIKVQKQNLQW